MSSVNFRAITVHPERVKEEEVSAVTIGEYLSQVIKFIDLPTFMCECVGKLQDASLQQQFEKLFTEFIIEAFCVVPQYWASDLTICNKILYGKLESLPKLDQKLKEILEFQDVVQFCNFDKVIRKLFIDAIEKARLRAEKPLEKAPVKAKSAVASEEEIDIMASDLPVKKKKLKLKVEPVKDEATPPKKVVRIKPPSETDEDESLKSNPFYKFSPQRLVAAIILDKKKNARTIQVNVTKCISADKIRVQDAFPMAAHAAKWDISVTAAVDYLSCDTKALTVGEKVLALFNIDGGMSTEFYPGRVAILHEDGVTISYEDDDRQKVGYDQVFPMSDLKDVHLLQLSDKFN